MNCRKVQPLLFEYIDNTLSARETWEVDRHVSECNECARELNELRRTVGFVSDAPRLEVSDDFMASLQSKLATVEPAPARWAWIEAAGSLLRPRVLPVLGTAVGIAAIVFMVFLPLGKLETGSQIVNQSAEPASVQSAARQNLALQAADPFADLAAANLSAHVSTDLASDTETVK